MLSIPISQKTNHRIVSQLISQGELVKIPNTDERFVIQSSYLITLVQEPQQRRFPFELLDSNQIHLHRRHRT